MSVPFARSFRAAKTVLKASGPLTPFVTSAMEEGLATVRSTIDEMLALPPRAQGAGSAPQIHFKTLTTIAFSGGQGYLIGRDRSLDSANSDSFVLRPRSPG